MLSLEDMMRYPRFFTTCKFYIGEMFLVAGLGVSSDLPHVSDFSQLLTLPIRRNRNDFCFTVLISKIEIVLPSSNMYNVQRILVIAISFIIIVSFTDIFGIRRKVDDSKST